MPLSDIAGVLFDLDGVLCVGDRGVDGAPQAVRRIRSADLACRFVTNTSTQSRDSLLQKLGAMGFDVEPQEIFSAPLATYAYLRRHRPDARCHLLLADDVRASFSGLHQVDLDRADCIVVGDIGDAWNYELLNRLFKRLIAGAELIAVHKNRFWQTESGLRMDIGGFVAALEYCAGVRALVMGKPSPDFFRTAVEDMGLPARRLLIVGDDIDMDIGGGQAAGLHGVLVRTGKYRAPQVEASTVTPDRIIDSVADLPDLLGLDKR